jgi:heme/copper-type cytochrome/quinol oxidase subunit 1
MLSLLIRLELCLCSNKIVILENQYLYNMLITLHGLYMIFFFIMPSLFGGVGNIFVPVLHGTADIVYPRLNAVSLIVLYLSFILMYLAYYNEYSTGVGWTLYPPLSTSLSYASSVGTDTIVLSL